MGYGSYRKESSAPSDQQDTGEADLFNSNNTEPETEKNKFSNKKIWPSTLEKDKQGKHIEGHPNYQSGKSKLTISMSEAEKLVEIYSGTGKVIGDNKENIDFQKIIGIYVDPSTENEYPTTKGTIHHSKKGTHIVPKFPD